jgi:alkylation response protein AidB-like acyl-CoA dehydrogenase
MNLTFTEEQEILRKFAKDFMTEKLPKKVLKELEKTEDGYSKDMWKEMADLGWIGLPFPENTVVPICLLWILRCCLKKWESCPARPYLPTVVLGGMTILKLGTEEQKKEYLPKISSGQMVVTMAIDEADKSITTPPDAVKAAKEGGSWS